MLVAIAALASIALHTSKVCTEKLLVFQQSHLATGARPSFTTAAIHPIQYCSFTSSASMVSLFLISRPSLALITTYDQAPSLVNRNLPNMSDSNQTSHEIPLGIEPEVLIKINELLEQSVAKKRRPGLGMQSASITRANGMKDDDRRKADEAEGVSMLEELAPKPNESKAHKILNDEPDIEDVEASENTTPVPMPTINADIGSNYENSIPPANLFAENIIARYIYSRASRRHPDRPRQSAVPTVSTLLGMFCIYLMSIFLDVEPDIIEYSIPQMMAKIKLRVKAQAVEFAIPPKAPLTPSQQSQKVFSVATLLHVEDGNSMEPTRTVPIIAKPKRVRELMGECHVHNIAEDVYREEISGAFRGLRQKMEKKWAKKKKD
ncbi:hypothetical protein CC86DRAFT_382391 [Ophiobolus disseminans]|uniref:Uncharacterized protein n=1 Tax=Ophiobolus disseminans TaxID=1469910 RepID=A0A6A7A0L6_9PLEO|nr:hypothetical protein CC86DRAFT_382391 [Ophiobolus disseminans]